ncbi:hypothetical protein DYB37_000543 [Aphanomyces astaci]|uniref:Uncharacterized protein n=2 Tax=Aphanomyces astaci TaxID=112090 RepID=A0A3R7B4E0_APHAT|nr:hypothetical protein DYB35_000166 [Aphanomyces astaci]RHZ27488.1 hypothetical protein DYB37_000543 [Aphanomyces astaci]
MHPIRRKSVVLEEDENEPKKTLQQKEVISAQMIDVVQTRLDSLRSVPGLPDPYETNHVVATGRLRTSAALAMNARNQLLMERLFGPDEKLRTRNKTMKKSKADMLKSETRRNKRAQLEKLLQVSIERHVTRTVDSVLTSADSNNKRNIDLNAKLLLSHTIEKMRIVQGKKTFKRFVLTEISCTQFEQIFWLVFTRIFQKNADDADQMECICALYVKMLSVLRLNKDLIFRIYPYAIAGSVFVIVCELLLGLKLCPISVQMMRKQYFPEDQLDELTGKMKYLDSAESTPPGQLPGSSNSLRKSASDFTLSMVSTELTLGFVRASFNAAQLSPLMKEYLATNKEGLKKPCFLRRTTPVDRCLVGGEDTYRKTFTKKDQAVNFAQQSSELYGEYRKDVLKYQQNAHNAIKLIDETKDIVLNGGKAAIKAYKAILQNHSILEEAADQVPVQNSNVVATTRPTKHVL